MNKPLWFELISKWKEWGRGYYGITFPFLVGALSRSRKIELNEAGVAQAFNEIASNPVEGFYCEVRWCSDIDEPVATMKPHSDLEQVVIQGNVFSRGQVSFGFTADLMGMFGLDCKDSNECIEKLIERTFGIVAAGNFSKNQGLFTPYTAEDIKFISKVEELHNT